MKDFSAMEASALLYFNWKFAKKLYENQFKEVIEPYRKTILKRCDEIRTRDVCKALGSILRPDAFESDDARILNRDFLLFTAAAADIIIWRQIEDSKTEMPEPSRN